jgi:methylglyoxal synthase
MSDTSPRLRLVLVAHDNRKADLVRWALARRDALAGYELSATGTTGSRLAQELDLPVRRFLSGPLGGDLQIGAEIAEGRLDALVFFWDPLSAQPHDPDVKALLRVAVLWNLPFACNEASADALLETPRLLALARQPRPHLENYREQRESPPSVGS